MSEQSEGREAEAKVEALKAQIAEAKEEHAQIAEEYYVALQAVLDLNEPGKTEHTRAVRQRLADAEVKFGEIIAKRNALAEEIRGLLPKEETEGDY